MFQLLLADVVVAVVLDVVHHVRDVGRVVALRHRILTTCVCSRGSRRVRVLGSTASAPTTALVILAARNAAEVSILVLAR